MSARAVNRGGIDVGRVDLEPFLGRKQRGADGPGAAAQLEDDVARRGVRNRLLRKEFGTPARNEDPFGHRDPQSAELRPADNDFERDTADPPGHHRLERRRVGRLSSEQPGLVLGEDAPGCSKSADELIHQPDTGRIRQSVSIPVMTAMPLTAGSIIDPVFFHRSNRPPVEPSNA